MIEEIKVIFSIIVIIYMFIGLIYATYYSYINKENMTYFNRATYIIFLLLIAIIWLPTVLDKDKD